MQLEARRTAEAYGIDEYMAAALLKEDYKSLNKLWKNLSNEMKERLYAYRDKINE